jgi:hypothetical protein
MMPSFAVRPGTTKAQIRQTRGSCGVLFDPGLTSNSNGG